ncbi:unnamed protein product [Vitrella brassicaformis CCMP3155]|uniref:uDENN domain-containing protein n=1 Tax=Vitrella brassicaformis (strain CCMP3155) TaxID=1169540 RepID=A0A0G4EM38_VITBC|nr:unnamed protein product [Vitrella brassicaformis CCMP3155]|eukprot:CEL97918.1 unnamed protein product [Vitrella brassicaformis CCMP3155]
MSREVSGPLSVLWPFQSYTHRTFLPGHDDTRHTGTYSLYQSGHWSGPHCLTKPTYSDALFLHQRSTRFPSQAVSSPHGPWELDAIRGPTDFILRDLVEWLAVLGAHEAFLTPLKGQIVEWYPSHTPATSPDSLMSAGMGGPSSPSSRKDSSPSAAMQQTLTSFCPPEGLWLYREEQGCPGPVFFSTVLWGLSRRAYVCCLMVWEPRAWPWDIDHGEMQRSGLIDGMVAVTEDLLETALRVPPSSMCRPEDRQGVLPAAAAQDTHPASPSSDHSSAAIESTIGRLVVDLSGAGLARPSVKLHIGIGDTHLRAIDLPGGRSNGGRELSYRALFACLKLDRIVNVFTLLLPERKVLMLSRRAPPSRPPRPGVELEDAIRPVQIISGVARRSRTTESPQFGRYPLPAAKGPRAGSLRMATRATAQKSCWRRKVSWVCVRPPVGPSHSVIDGRGHPADPLVTAAHARRPFERWRRLAVCLAGSGKSFLRECVPSSASHSSGSACLSAALLRHHSIPGAVNGKPSTTEPPSGGVSVTPCPCADDQWDKGARLVSPPPLLPQGHDVVVGSEMDDEAFFDEAAEDIMAILEDAVMSPQDKTAASGKADSASRPASVVDKCVSLDLSEASPSDHATPTPPPAIPYATITPAPDVADVPTATPFDDTRRLAPDDVIEGESQQPSAAVPEAPRPTPVSTVDAATSAAPEQATVSTSALAEPTEAQSMAVEGPDNKPVRELTLKEVDRLRLGHEDIVVSRLGGLRTSMSFSLPPSSSPHPTALLFMPRRHGLSRVAI